MGSECADQGGFSVLGSAEGKVRTSAGTEPGRRHMGGRGNKMVFSLDR